MELGQLDVAVKSYERAMKHWPDYAEAHYNLGNTLMELGQLDAAVRSYERALKFRPEFAAGHNNLGNVLKELGQLDAAVASYQRALELKPDYAEAHQHLSVLKKYNPGDVQIDLMESLFSSPESDESDRICLCFAPAKAYEDIGEYDKSFGYLNEGNRLHRKELIYNINDDRRLFSWIKEIFSEKSSPPSVAPSDEHTSIRPVFIVGMPRSGTTLVEQILASHKKVHGAGELRTMSKLVFPILSKPSDQVAGQHSIQLTKNDIETLRGMITSRHLQQ